MHTEAVRQLLETSRSQVLMPGDDAYEEARAVYNGMATGRPACIVRPSDLADLVAAVRWARGHGIPVGVRGGGHNVAGYSAPEGAILIDLSRWRGATVDPVTRTADALAGSRLVDLDVATIAHGLAAPSGTFYDTGIGGLTLTGGISWLISSEGYACDALVGAQLVTVDGEVIEVDERREPELLWGLRGGGGNFGIVTRLRYSLAAVDTVFGGEMEYRGDGVADAIARAFELDAAAPDELVLTLEAWRAPDGGPAAMIQAAWRGDGDDGRRALQPLVDHPACVGADLKRLSWLQLQAMNQPVPFGFRHYWKGHLAGSTDAQLAEAITEAGMGASGSSFILVELIHGRAHRIPREWASFGGRSAVANVTAIAKWGDPAEDADQIAWARAFAGRVERVSLRGGGYLNYPELDQTEARVAAAFPPDSWARLRRLKRRLDPDNVLRYNANIPPAVE